MTDLIYFQPYLRGDRPDIILLNEEAGLLILKIINPTFMENANIIVPSWVPKTTSLSKINLITYNTNFLFKYFAGDRDVHMYF